MVVQRPQYLIPKSLKEWKHCLKSGRKQQQTPTDEPYKKEVMSQGQLKSINVEVSREVAECFRCRFIQKSKKIYTQRNPEEECQERHMQVQRLYRDSKLKHSIAGISNSDTFEF